MRSTNTFDLVVTPVNDPPFVVDDRYVMSQGDVLVVSAAGVLANDSDVERQSLTARKVSDPAHGSLTLNADGSFTYTPAVEFFGVDSFTYRAHDGETNSASRPSSAAKRPLRAQ